MKVIDVKLNALVSSLAAALLAAGCSTAPAPAASTPAAPPVTVSFGRVETADLSPLVEAGGVVRPRATAVIASRVMATVVDVLVHPGDRVRRGAPLVRLDAREITAAGARAAAALDAARRSADAAASDTRAAEAGLRMARLTHERIATLNAKRSATLQELDQADGEPRRRRGAAGRRGRPVGGGHRRARRGAGGGAGRADCGVLCGAQRAVRRPGRRTPCRSRHHGDARRAAADPRGRDRVPARRCGSTKPAPRRPRSARPPTSASATRRIPTPGAGAASWKSPASTPCRTVSS